MTLLRFISHLLSSLLSLSLFFTSTNLTNKIYPLPPLFLPLALPLDLDLALPRPLTLPLPRPLTLVLPQVTETLGWTAGALLTPVTMGLVGLPFFLCIIFGGTTAGKALLMAVYVGLAQNVLSKGTKYAVFDPTKEMTYIPLDHTAKTKGKAAIDVVGARLGKAGGALIQQVLVLLCGSIMQGAPIVAIFFYLTIAAWIGAVLDLAPKFRDRTAIMTAKIEKKKKARGGM